jgi:hypothetical protein
LAEALKTFRYDVLNVRAGRTFGSETTLPTREDCQSAGQVIEFIQRHGTDRTLRFVVHPVQKSYFNPLLVGTIALHYSPSAKTVIEFQEMKNNHEGEPRDWPVNIRHTFPFMARMPTAYLSDESRYSLQNISSHVFECYEIAMAIIEIKNSLQSAEENSLTRFRIYRSGRIILQDHRSPDSFAMRR